MKKIKQTGINKKTQKILNELNEISEMMILDVIMCNMDSNNMKKYVDKNLSSYEQTFHQIVELIFKNSPIINTIIYDLIQINNARIGRFEGITIEELKKEFDKNIIPAIFGEVGITPSMVIFYYISEDIEKDEMFNFSVEEQKKRLKKGEEKAEYLKNSNEIIRLKGKLKNSVEEFAINAFYKGEITDNAKKNLKQYYEEICEIYHAEMIDNNKMLINPNIMLFFHDEFENIVKLKYSFGQMLGYISTVLNTNMNILQHNREKFQKNKEIYSELDKIKRENESLKREIDFLNKAKINDSKENSTNKLLEFKKENYYLKTKIEKLEKELSEKNEEIENIKEIKDDIKIEKQIINKKVEIYNDESIVIIGGKWDSKKKAEVHKKYNVDFISPEDVFKNSLRIKSYDIVIFDISRNSHKNYYKVKALTEDLYLINKSDIKTLNKIFQK